MRTRALAVLAILVLATGCGGSPVEPERVEVDAADVRPWIPLDSVAVDARP